MKGCRVYKLPEVKTRHACMYLDRISIFVLFSLLDLQLLVHVFNVFI